MFNLNLMRRKYSDKSKFKRVMKDLTPHPIPKVGNCLKNTKEIN